MRVENSIVACSIFTLQDKRIKTYRLGEIVKDKNAPPKKQKGVFDMQKTATYTEGDNTLISLLCIRILPLRQNNTATNMSSR